jgi:hypothetical protein
MKPVVKQLERFRSVDAWANRILRIDLGTMGIEVQEAESCVAH